MHGILNTRMPIPKRVFVTRATAVAMKKILAATNSAYATFITVILFFLCLVIKKLALVTVVSTHAHTTVLAHLLHILLTIAKRANDLHTRSTSLSLPSPCHYIIVKIL